MLIDTMFARDMYQVYEINDDLLNMLQIALRVASWMKSNKLHLNSSRTK